MNAAHIVIVLMILAALFVLNEAYGHEPTFSTPAWTPLAPEDATARAIREQTQLLRDIERRKQFKEMIAPVRVTPYGVYKVDRIEPIKWPK